MQKEKEWLLAYSTTIDYQAHIIKDMLENYGIDAIVINKKDSVYVTIGTIEIYVNQDNLIESKLLIQKFFKSEQSN